MEILFFFSLRVATLATKGQRRQHWVICRQLAVRNLRGGWRNCRLWIFSAARQWRPSSYWTSSILNYFLCCVFFFSFLFLFGFRLKSWTCDLVWAVEEVSEGFHCELFKQVGDVTFTKRSAQEREREMKGGRYQLTIIKKKKTFHILFSLAFVNMISYLFKRTSSRERGICQARLLVQKYLATQDSTYFG